MSTRTTVVALALGTCIAAAAAGWWRANEVTSDLHDSERRLAAAERELAAATDTATSRITAIREETSTLAHDVRRLRRELKERQPCNGPRLVLSRSSGPPGTRVTFHGYCFVGELWRNAGGRGERSGLFLIHPAHDLSDPALVAHGGPDCELMAGVHPSQLVVKDNGTASGYFTIPHIGGCAQEDRRASFVPDTYYVGLECHACFPLARFRVTG